MNIKVKREDNSVKVQFKIVNFIYIPFICFVLIFFVNCSEGENYNYDNNNNIIFTHRNENTPNMKSIIDRLTGQCPIIMQSAWNASKPGWGSDLRFLDLVVEALRVEDQRWGYTFWTRTGYADSWAVDRVGYFHGTGDPHNSTDMTVIDYLTARQESGEWTVYSAWTDVTQQLKTEYPDATGYWRYPRSGATVSLSDCRESGGGACSSNQREPHYKEVNGQCLPSCGHANNLYCQSESASGRQCGAIARGNNCSGTDNFDIHILETYEEVTCCNRKPKHGGQSGVCLPSQKAPHYKVVGQECLPSCGHAANMAGYGGRGPDNQKHTSDDPHVYGSNVRSCAKLERFGHSDWMNFSWTDRHTSKAMNNNQIYEVVQNSGVCCVRGNPTRRPPTTSTTTTQNNNGLSRRSDNPPNMLHVVKRVANSHRQVLLNSCRRGHENLDFLDLVLTELRKENEGIRWGFNCKRGDCNHLSIDAIAYYRGTGSNLNNSTDVAIFDIIASCHSDSPRPAWQDMTQATKDNGTIGRYKYPR